MAHHANAPTDPVTLLADFKVDRRLIALTAMALVVGVGGVVAAWVLLKLIALVTNLVWLGHVSVAPVVMGDLPRTPWMVAAPALGGLAIGLMARFGSEKIRGHGIPEAIEAILIGGSRMSPKVAVLKPLSSAISIGAGGPFGAEGPIIMTGGALGSLFAQFFHLSAAERKTLLVAGAAAGMTATFGSPVASILLAVELLLFEWKPRSFIPVALAAVVAAAWRPFLFTAGPLFPMAPALDLPAWGLACAGAIGLLAAQVARASGAESVTVTDVSEYRLSVAESLGFTAIAASASPPGEYDVFLECSGAQTAVTSGMARIAPAGRVVLVGMGADSVAIDVPLLQGREMTISGVFRYARTYPVALHMISAGQVDVGPVITHRFGLADTAAAMTLAHRDPHAIKAIISPHP
jgi:hypothetical protein